MLQGVGAHTQNLSSNIYGAHRRARLVTPKVIKGGQIVFEEIPDLPSYGQTEEEAERPQPAQLKPASSDALLFAFRRCHNYIAGNQGLQKPEAFWELLKLIFCKIHDERESVHLEFYAAANERNGINGPLKVKGRLDKLFGRSKKTTRQSSRLTKPSPSSRRSWPIWSASCKCIHC